MAARTASAPRARTTSIRSDPAQLGLPLRKKSTWGGAREGAGRKRGAGVQHVARARVPRGLPAHVTLRVHENVPNLRDDILFTAVEQALAGVLGRPGFRVVHFSVQSSHIHLIVEAATTRSLACGIQALKIRVALGVNRALNRRGRVFVDRYHARLLRTPREVRNALCYVLQNYRRHHAAEAERRGGMIDPTWLDPRSSATAFDGWRDRPEVTEARPPPPVSAPTFWLLRNGWRRHGLLDVDETPPAAWG